MADYRYITLAERSVEWTAKSGNAVKIDVTLVREEMDYFRNGDYQPTSDALAIRTTGYVDGMDVTVGDWIKPRADVVGIVASIGTIGLTAERLAEVELALSEVKSHPEWIAKIEADKRADQAEIEYQQHAAAVENMMTLGGKTY